MAGRTLRHTLVVRHPETSQATPLVAGSEVPEWADALVHDDDTYRPEPKAKPRRASSKASEDDNS